VWVGCGVCVGHGVSEPHGDGLGLGVWVACGEAHGVSCGEGVTLSSGVGLGVVSPETEARITGAVAPRRNRTARQRTKRRRNRKWVVGIPGSQKRPSI
jgi:hypothetical protein